jgi:hypothetical protein
LFIDSRISLEQAAAIADRQNRGITPEQHRMIVEFLKPPLIIKGKVEVNAAFDAEAWQFGDEILGVLKEVGFDAAQPSFAERAISYNKRGLFLWVKDAKKPPKDAGRSVQACRDFDDGRGASARYG